MMPRETSLPFAGRKAPVFATRILVRATFLASTMLLPRTGQPLLRPVRNAGLNCEECTRNM